MEKYWKVCSKAVCAGRNYVAHAAELNNPLPSAPFFFVKPTSTFLPFNDTPFAGASKKLNTIEYPIQNKLHHEVELMVVIGKEARAVNEADALSYVSGYSIGLDMTLRDVQEQYKQQKLPWTAAKAFDTSLALGPFVPVEQISNPNDVEVWLTVNGEFRQKDSTALMIFSIERLIAEASKIMTLYPGDVIATGTPKGVGQVESGDILRAGIVGFESLDVEFVCSGL